MNVLVTGASKGIGRELVLQYAADSNNMVYALSRDQAKLESLKTECHSSTGNDIHIYSINFLAENFTDQFKKFIEKTNVSFNIVVNNAGLLEQVAFEQANRAIIQKIFQVNFVAPLLLTQIIIHQNAISTPLHVINIGSMGGYQGSSKFPGLSIYSASKAALANLTESLAEEFKDTNIKFNCLALGSVNTEMLKQAFPEYKASMEPSELAKHIIYFSKNGHKFYNGKVLPVANTTP